MASFASVTASGYLLSASCYGDAFVRAPPACPQLHKWALWVITVGFGVLTLISAAGVLLHGGKETRGKTSQLLASMCLLLFAVTFSHFGTGHPPRPWSKELLVHHAGIPVALLILLQDYRFVFLDAFVRFLANVFLAAVLAFAGIRIAIALAPEDGSSHPLGDTLAVAGLCGLLILFAYLRGIVQRWFTMAVFRRSSIDGAVQELRSKAVEIRNEGAYLKWAAERLAAVAGTQRFEILEYEASQDRSGSTMRDLDYPSLAEEEPWLGRDARVELGRGCRPDPAVTAGGAKPSLGTAAGRAAVSERRPSRAQPLGESRGRGSGTLPVRGDAAAGVRGGIACASFADQSAFSVQCAEYDLWDHSARSCRRAAVRCSTLRKSSDISFNPTRY